MKLEQKKVKLELYEDVAVNKLYIAKQYKKTYNQLKRAVNIG